ncbi:response regulator transcription factor [Siphonobacter sp. SORGH_AS_0500]|uniref:response regulator transcription factor n=1 Tax=Siphonobacter sp. SORGH_AS_0500 TaxID=1864824 RepID=UPI002861960F|nr:response regulator transcription factor [Siphonobacter sp. SORGH_AS_0500]MDR6197400.1 DNA-binding NarL/FixJ family response regulator [Siphonobacter sp. SORGH_AS_0500]
MNKKLKIVIADDHPYVVQAFKSTITMDHNLTVVATAPDGQQVLEVVAKYQPDVVFMDIRMPRMNGIEATRYLSNTKSGAKVICVTGFDDEDDLMNMLKAGAKGIILKTSEPSEILRAVEKVMNGEEYFCRDGMMVMIKRFMKNAPSVRKAEFDGYSSKEMEIIKLIGKQKTSKEISEELFLGEHTINYYRQRIMEKMNVKTSIGIVLYALKNNMMSLNELF